MQHDQSYRDLTDDSPSQSQVVLEIDISLILSMGSCGQFDRASFRCLRRRLPSHYLILVMRPFSFNCSIGISLLLLHIFAQLHRLMGQSPEGFISVDCGGNGMYEDPEVRGMWWTSDDKFVYGGNISKVDPPSTAGGPPQFTTIRYFPGNQTKYCYSLPGLSPQSFYLVRASFWYGTRSIYETKAENQIRFKLLVDADEWATISITLPQENPAVHEMYVRAIGITISVCLAGKGIGLDTPFISTIELRPLKAGLNGCETMSYTQRALHKEYRLNFGALSNASVRYPNDIFDRIWDPRRDEPDIRTDAQVYVGITDKPPVVVLQTAYGGSGLRSFDISLPVDSDSHLYFFALYFAEIDPRVNSSGQRVFNIDHSFDAIVDRNEDIYSLVSGRNSVYQIYRQPESSFQAFGSINFSFQALSNSSYGPLINGLEVLRLSDEPQSNGTFAGDVLAVQDIMDGLHMMGWAGDPCLPYAYDWLNCSQPPFPVRINALLLSNRRLAGAIPSSINKLTELVQISLDQNDLFGDIPNLNNLQNLKVLNLTNNSLSGTIPDFFSHMPSLQILLLENNNLSGEVPDTLLQMSKGSSLYLDFAGNPFLCTSACPTPISHNKSDHLALIAGLLAGFLILGWAAACYAFVKARHHGGLIRSQQRNVIGQTELVERSNTTHAFSFDDIKVATDNFSRKLGEGGFGPVYQGTLRSGAVVAIKLLSDASRQGIKEFLNEVDILSRVHHTNLVRLVGYCIEQKLVLVYEYMSKGALSESLRGKGIPLDWRTRLRIALDAAQGLAYLHWGCSPRIIHRDVKSSNILLNEKMEAKIADFGISKSKGGNTNTLTSTAVVGSRGYVDPEYANGMSPSQKIDVYSFGVVLFEIICGQPPIFQTMQNEQVHIIDWARHLLQQGNIQELVDNRIANGYNWSTLRMVFELGMICVHSDGNMRPTMTEVCIELREAIRMEFPSEQIDNVCEDKQHDYLESTSESFSITQVQAR